MLDVGDNLERAYSAVPQEALQGKDKQGEKLSADAAVQLLISLTDGVKLTEKIFDRVRKIAMQKAAFCMTTYAIRLHRIQPDKLPAFVELD